MEEFCSICTIRIEAHAKISLDDLCKIGHGFESSTAEINKKRRNVDKDLTCILCFACFGEVQDAKQLMREIKMMTDGLKATVVTLKTKLETSNGNDVPGKWKGSEKQKMRRQINKIHAVLKNAFAPDPPNNLKILSENVNFKKAEQKKPSKVLKVTQINERDLASIEKNGRQPRTRRPNRKFQDYCGFDFDYDGKPFVDQANKASDNDPGGCLVLLRRQTNFDAGDADWKEPTITEEPRKKRKYTRKSENVQPRRKRAKNDQDEDFTLAVHPVPKRKYVKRKQELQIENNYDPEEDGFLMPVIKSVRSVAQTRNAIPNLQMAGDDTWLTDNIEIDEDGIILRSVLYRHYFDYCLENKRVPPNQATFGKLVKAMFPDVKTRRLGTRGNSQYCYAGIKIKDDSPLHNVTLDNGDIPALVSSEQTANTAKTGRGKTSLLEKLGYSTKPRKQQNVHGVFVPLPTYGSNDYEERLLRVLVQDQEYPEYRPIEESFQPD